MKNVLAVAATLAVGALAQNAQLTLPVAGQSVKAGAQLTVQIQRPTPPTNTEEMAVAIGLQSCPDAACYPTSEMLGSLLYNGPYDPEYHEYYLPQYQNFTVTIPAGTAAGKATLGVARSALTGASEVAFLQFLNQTITIT
ncbi:hypothetical protein BO71DRAFT_395222 [Aspergillus ellipticus CBS 707.79]|uniref:Uncharacterized protein n=1 Tax=Aspergillus ellipticus CBS 707.79 TaxID=1448320 RepID=A0A319DLG2_9EURO|nr:hypothetical protein BO71DRAFT_395222 [Aspergillus ellipticus CBS 707.79]